jgi:putative addiction module killer protein
MKRIKKTAVYEKWEKAMRGTRAQALIDMRIGRLATGNPGKCRFLGDKVTELIIDYGPGYRVYYTTAGKEIVLLLCGGDKSTQQDDIEKACKLAAGYGKGV